jgi:hypothetical protein
VRIAATPPGAQIFVDDVAADANPWVHSAPRDGARHRVRVEADGHEPASFDLAFVDDIDRVVTLVPRASPTKPPARTSPRPAAACDPPFFVDGNGIKTYKPECL